MENDEYIRVKVSEIQAIAEAIRTALGITSTFKISDMPQLIAEIADSQGQAIEEVALTFRDYVPKNLSSLPSASAEVDNTKLTFYTDANGTASTVTVDDIRDRIIKTVEDENETIQTNQYVFEKM